MSHNRKYETKSFQSCCSCSVILSNYISSFPSPYLMCWLSVSSLLSHGHMIAARAPNITLHSSVPIREEWVNHKVF